MTIVYNDVLDWGGTSGDGEEVCCLSGQMNGGGEEWGVKNDSLVSSLGNWLVGGAIH